MFCVYKFFVSCIMYLYLNKIMFILNVRAQLLRKNYSRNISSIRKWANIVCGLGGFLVIQQPGAQWFESRRDQFIFLYISFLFFVPANF